MKSLKIQKQTSKFILICIQLPRDARPLRGKHLKLGIFSFILQVRSKKVDFWSSREFNFTAICCINLINDLKKQHKILHLRER